MSNGLLQALGSRVKTLRVKNNWSQEELAERAGFHRTYVGMVERGERNPSLISLSSLAGALEVDLSTLLEGIDEC